MLFRLLVVLCRFKWTSYQTTHASRIATALSPSTSTGFQSYCLLIPLAPAKATNSTKSSVSPRFSTLLSSATTISPSPSKSSPSLSPRSPSRPNFSSPLAASASSPSLSSSNISLLDQYLTAGCDINCTSDFFSQVDGDYLDGATALIIAATHHANELVNHLLQNGADVTLTNRNGDSALHRACWSGDLEILQKLVEYGALIDGPNYNGLTPCTERESG